MLRLTLKLFLLFALAWPIVAQTTGDRTFTHLGRRDGLTHSSISAIVQDRYGFVWLGSVDGLNRYDASRIETFRADTLAGSLAENQITTLGTSRAGKIFVGSVNAVSVYHARTRRFETLPNPAAPTPFVTSAIEVARGADDVYIATLGLGLCHYDPAAGMRRIPLRVAGRPVDDVYDVLGGTTPDLLLATADGVVRYDPASSATSQLPFSLNGTNISVRAISLHRGAGGVVYAGTLNRGLFQLGVGEATFRPVPLPATIRDEVIIRCISTDSEGNLWIGTDGDGLLIRSPDGDYEHYRADEGNPKSISSSTVDDIYHAPDGITWLGHYSGGVSIYDPQTPRVINYGFAAAGNRGLTNGNVRALHADADGQVWIGTRNGLNRLDPTTENVARYPYGEDNGLGAPIILSIAEDNRNAGGLWVGTFGGGLYRFDKTSGRFVSYRTTASPRGTTTEDAVYVIHPLGEELLLGTQGSLLVFNPATGRSTTVAGPTFVTDVLADRDGRVWLAAAEGVFSYAPGPKTASKVWPAGVEERRAFAIHRGKNEEFWLGTRDAGLHRWRPASGESERYGRAEGLPSSTVLSITPGRNGELWLGTNNGLSRFAVRSETFTNLAAAHDGIVNTEYNIGSATTTAGGWLYFGGTEGLDRVADAPLPVNDRELPVYLTSLTLRVDGREVSDVDYFGENVVDLRRVTLGADVDAFSFTATALNYTAAAKNVIEYRLEGLEEGWRTADATSSVTYTSVPPGNYSLQLRATNNDGNGSGNYALALEIQPPIYRRWYAILLYAAALLGLVLLYNHFTLRETKMKNQLQIAALENEKKTELNRTKLVFFTNISHELRTPLTLITTPLQSILQNLKAGDPSRPALELVQRNARRLADLVNQLMDFHKVESGHSRLDCYKIDLVAYVRNLVENFRGLAAASDITLSFQPEPHQLEAYFAPDALDKILYNLLSNAIKFSDAGGVVSVLLLNDGTDDRGRPTVRLVVKDTGRGIERSQLDSVFDRFYVEDSPSALNMNNTGIGLALVKSLVAAYQGRIAVDTQVGQGTRFSVRLPYFLKRRVHPDGPFYFHAADEAVPKFHRALVMPAPPVPGADQTPPTDAELPVLLVIEDDVDILTYISQALAHRFRVITASNGREGLDLARKAVPDIVLSDVMMPLMNGLQLTTALRKDPTTSHVPIVLLTAKTSLEDQLEGFNAGVDDYLVKPFDLELLMARLQSLLNVRGRLGRKNQRLVLGTDAAAPLELTSPDEEFLNHLTKTLAEYVEDADFNVDRLAIKLALSRSVLYRKVKALTTLSPGDLLKQYRLSLAAKLLLKYRDLKVAEVAYRVGFKDPKYFGKCFRQYYQSSPSGWRSKHDAHTEAGPEPETLIRGS